MCYLVNTLHLQLPERPHHLWLLVVGRQWAGEGSDEKGCVGKLRGPMGWDVSAGGGGWTGEGLVEGDGNSGQRVGHIPVSFKTVLKLPNCLESE